MDKKIRELIGRMTLDEKASLCSGLNHWETKPVERLAIPSVMMSDGPHGLRKQEQDPDHLALSGSVPATCYPTASALACTWNRDLLEDVGAHLGKECQAQKVDIILGPGTNIKRSPLCGRNFEYFSEDPFLSSELAASHISGVQSEGIGTSLKHFAANNQEYKRLLTDTVIDERSLREIYLASFESVVKKSQPWTVMCAYNKINGSFCSENSRILTEILRDEWGFEGFVVSDWGAVNERVAGLKAGLELEMPSCRGDRDKQIVRAVRSGELDEKVLDRAVERILRIVYKAVGNRREGIVFDAEEHRRFAREAAAECMVLLKNEEKILPLTDISRLAVIGGFAEYPRYQGGGSSHVNPTSVDIPVEEIKKIARTRGIAVEFSEGYQVDRIKERYSNKRFESASDIPDEKLIEAACRAAEKADVAVIFTGLPETYESEGFDRKHISIPAGHEKLIEEVAKVQPRTVVLLSNGSPIEMPWLGKVKGVIEGYLGGQAFGGAAADILFGIANPSGKLAETFPLRVQDNPSFLNFPGNGKSVEYREGLFVGYRYYDAVEREPLFPFGYGLSYTDFSYESITADREEMTNEEELTLTVTIRNRGDRSGKEIVQLYIGAPDAPVQRPVRELKGFEKIYLEPGEAGSVTFRLDKRAFAFYDTDLKDWNAAGGAYDIGVGPSSRDLPLKRKFTLKPAVPVKKRYTRNSTISEIYESDEGKAYFNFLVEEKKIKGGMNMEEISVFFHDMPLRSFHMIAGEMASEKRIHELLADLNR